MISNYTDTMNSDIVLDTEWLNVRYYPDSGIIHHTWKKSCSGEVFRDMMLEASDYLAAHKGSKWLSDDRLFTVMTEADSLWGRRVWFPRTIHAGWKHWAMLLPERYVGQVSMQAILTEYKAAGINAKIFDSVAAALEWLGSQ